MYRLIIAGSRSWTSYHHLIEAAKHFNQHYQPGNEIQIISGGAKGADALGEQLAREYGLDLYIMPAEWSKYGKSAGYRRNKEMAEYADGCIVLWDGVSKGSEHMMNLAKEHGLELLVVTLKAETDFIDPVDDLPWR